MKPTSTRGIKIIAFLAALAATSHAAEAVPFHGCTFYKPRLTLPSFAGGTPWAGCASFSAVTGRNACRKVKGICPFCVTYAGDDVQMWLPDYYIEVTRHLGRSAFAKRILAAN